MNLLERKVATAEAQPAREAVQRQLDHGFGLFADRAFEIAVFDDRDPGIGGSGRSKSSCQAGNLTGPKFRVQNRYLSAIDHRPGSPQAWPRRVRAKGLGICG